ncbi:hypothetical protein Angca_001712 [Angiostrongylus cantonensis]|nr:hypothetical protein Angca_001712 [Angiostrongylus cantonensis]
MLACEKRLSLVFLSCRLPSVPFPIRMVSDRVSNAYRWPIKRESQLEPKDGAPLYATRDSYGEQMKSQRNRTADAGSGVQPTKWQKRFLVITRLYQRQRDIPPYVAAGTMNRMYDRMRVVFILVGVTVFFVIFFFGEFSTHQRISRDRDAGVIVKKM